MRPFSTTVIASAGGNTFSNAFVVDTYSNPCNIGIGVNIDYGLGGNSALYTVQHTFADPFTVNLNDRSLTSLWLDNDVLVSAKVSDDTNYAFPPSAIRLKLYPAVSAKATITIIQAGPEN
jgi:hypothetical protein